jgi:hypothetical protein
VRCVYVEAAPPPPSMLAFRGCSLLVLEAYKGNPEALQRLNEPVFQVKSVAAGDGRWPLMMQIA